LSTSEINSGPTEPQAHAVFSTNLAFCCRAASLGVILFGCAGLLGWTLQSTLLKSVGPNLPPMVPNTAVSFALAGFALWLQQRDPAGVLKSILARSCAVILTLSAALTVGEYLFDWNAGIDLWLFPESLSATHGPIPGRPAILTATCFLLIGLSLAFLDAKPRHLRKVVEVLAVTVILISLLALIGHGCNVPSFYGWRSLYPNTGMALHTVVAFIVLGAGVLCARPDGGLIKVLTSATAGGVVARRLILAPVIIPLATGLLRMSAVRVGFYNGEFASWLFAFLNIFVFTAAIWWIATLLYRAETVRQAAEDGVRRLNAELEGRVADRTAELSQAVAALRESEARARLVLDTALDAVITMDSRGTVTSWNPEAEKIFGWSREDVVGRELAAAIIPPQHREAHKRGLSHYLTTGEGPVLNKRIEISALHRDGHEFPVELSITPVQSGGTQTFSAFVRDITGRKKAEEEIHKLNATLEQRVQERTAQLEAVNKELEAFSYSVSHDLRAPLRHIDGFANMLRHEAKDSLSETSQRYLGVISDATRQMGALIDDLLLFSRMGRAELHQQPLNMDELAREALQEIRRETEGRNINWQIHPLPEVRADRALMKLVWTNLLSNAIKYTRHREPAEIAIGGHEREAEIEFYVRDNGAGFDMRYAHKLFGVFQRLHQSEEFEGTGIGLANVRRIINRHGGRTWAEGKVDAGATVYFTLPKPTTT